MEHPVVTATNGKKNNDDSANRGPCEIDGCTMELRYDNGRVARVMAFPWRHDGNAVFTGDRAFITDPSKRKRN